VATESPRLAWPQKNIGPQVIIGVGEVRETQKPGAAEPTPQSNSAARVFSQPLVSGWLKKRGAKEYAEHLPPLNI